jgi:hypothetical protein
MDGLLVGPAIVVLLVACCGASNLTTVDCGMASNGVNACIDQAMQSCTPAKIRIAQVPVEVTITGSHDSGNCNVEMEGISVSSWESELRTFSPSDYADVQQSLQNPQAQAALAGLEGKTAQCVVPKDDAAAIGGQDVMDICQGDLVTYIDNMMRGNTG